VKAPHRDQKSKQHAIVGAGHAAQDEVEPSLKIQMKVEKIIVDTP
jgi:hypothetical protein